MKTLAYVLSLLFTLCSIAAAETVIKAVTEDGRNVILFSDGTWVFKPSKISKSNPQTDTRPNSAKSFVRGERLPYIVYYDPDKWKIEKRKQNENAEFEFQHVKGDAYAMLIAERIPIPFDSLKKIALSNIQDIAPGAKVVEEGLKIIDGQERLLLRIDGLADGIPVSYFGYYARGKWGTIQFVTFTSIALFPEYETDFAELLNGLSIAD